MKRFTYAQLGLIAALGLSSSAVAGGRNPASLLLYPEFDSRPGIATVITVTNTNATEDIDVHFVYRGRYGAMGTELDCLEFNLTEPLTPKDTLTVLASRHNAEHEQGFLYAYAQEEDITDPNYAQAIKFDHLIGHLLIVNGFSMGMLGNFEYSVNPVAFSAASGLMERALTDVDNDQIRDLDGMEYEMAPDEILVPRFLGWGDRADGKLILLALSGGIQYDTIAQFLIRNDNEEQFSRQYEFRCWAKEPLRNISNGFSHNYLKMNTGHNLQENLGANQEYGWFCITGGIANSNACTILDATVYGVYVEALAMTAAADLPFEVGENDGHLLPKAQGGDNSENPMGCL